MANDLLVFMYAGFNDRSIAICRIVGGGDLQEFLGPLQEFFLPKS